MQKITLCLLFLAPGLLVGQELLPLEKAIEIALRQNFDIQIAALEQRAAEMEIYRSNAGFGPVIHWNANVGGMVNNVQQSFLDGRKVDRFGRNISPGTNISLDLTLFDGGRMATIFERLKQLSQLSSLESQLRIQNTVVQVMEAYYQIMRQKETVNYLQTVIDYYEARLKITEERWQVGRGSKLDYLQSKTDLNVQLAELASANNEWKNGKIRLNQLLNRDLAINFEVQDIVLIRGEYVLNDLLDRAVQQNKELLLLNKTKAISLLAEQEIAALRKPQLSLNSALGYSYLNTNAGFLLTNQNLALNAGVTARWILFDGKHLNNQLAISKVNTQAVAKQTEQLIAEIKAELTAAYNQFLADRELLELEEENKALAEENLQISLEKFKIGGGTILELNEAQRSFDTALNRLVNAQYNIKISELQLLLLSGELMR